MNEALSMKLRLVAHGLELPADLKDYILRRIHFSLGRFADRIQLVSVTLSDINGPRGGVDQCCDIRVNAGFPHEVIVHERQAGIYTAVACAVVRAERAIVRRLNLANMMGRKPDVRLED